MKNQPHMTTLVIGDVLAWEGDRVVVSAVNDSAARIALPNGLTEIIPSPLNKFYVMENQPDHKELNNLVACYPDKASEFNKPIGEEDMKNITKTKTGSTKNAISKPRGGLAAEVAARKASEAAQVSGAGPKRKLRSPKSPKGPSAPSGGNPKTGDSPTEMPRAERKPAAEKGEPTCFKGRAEYTRSLAADPSLTVDEIHIKSRAKFPGASRKTTVQIVDKARSAKKA